MRKVLNNYLLIAAIVLVIPASVIAGNPDRAGEAGAYELLINPWARSTGWFGLNGANVSGVEALRLNVAGLAFTGKTEVGFTHTRWLQGSEIGINAVGFSQKFKEFNAFGVSLMQVDFGKIERTTTSFPEGGIGEYKPLFINIGIGYARSFSNSIHAGLVIRSITEKIEDLSSSGVALDAGIQYVTGPRDNVRFGISLRNVGTPMKFNGEGLAFRGPAPEGNYNMTQSQRTEKFELPSQLNISAAYDFYLDKSNENPMHNVAIVGQFTSNSFGKDQIGGGIQYSFKKYFQLRAGYRYEDGITKSDTRTSVYTGISAGFTVEIPLKKDSDTSLGIDYSFRSTDPYKGTHAMGIRFNL